MSITLKILVTGTGLTKAMRFAETMSVHEATKEIAEKTSEGGKDHGLFKPISETSGTSGGKWLRPEKALQFYDLKTNDFVEYRKKHEIVKVKLVDGTIKSIYADMSGTVEDVVAVVANKIGLKNPEEFSLQLDEKQEWLLADRTLLEQLDSLQQIVLLKKKFFVNDANIDRDDPIQLHLVYVQSRDDIVSGKHPTTKDEAVQLGAIQCQVEYGNLNPSSPNAINLKQILSPSFAKDKGLEKNVFTEWKKLTGMSDINAKYRYVQYCRSLKTYGITIFQVKERAKGQKKLVPKLLGFTRDSILKMNADLKTAVVGITTSTSGGYGQQFCANIGDIDNAANAMDRMINHMFSKNAAFTPSNSTTGQQQMQLINDHISNLGGLGQKLVALANGQPLDKQSLNQTAKTIAQTMEQLITAARNAQALGLDPDGLLFEGVKRLAECLNDLLKDASDVAKNPSEENRYNLGSSLTSAQAGLLAVQAAARGIKCDESQNRLLVELGKAVEAALRELISSSQSTPLKDQTKRPQVNQASNDLRRAGEQLVSLSSILGPTAQDPTCKSRIHVAGKSLQQAVNLLGNALKMAGVNLQDDPNLHDAMKKLNDALNGLLTCMNLPEMEGGNEAVQFHAAAQAILDATTALMGSMGRPEVMKSSVNTVERAGQNLQTAVKAISGTKDPAIRDRLLDYSQRVADALRGLLSSSTASIANPNDPKAHAKLRSAAISLAEATQALIDDVGKEVGLAALYSSAKLAAAATTTLVVSSSAARGKISDPKAENELLQNARLTTEAITTLVKALVNPSSVEAVLYAGEQFAPIGYQLVAAGKNAVPKINDPATKKELAYNADNAAKAIYKLLQNRNATKAQLGAGEVNQAIEKFQAAQATLEAALLQISQGTLKSNTPREEALKSVNGAIKAVAVSTKKLASSAKDSPEEIGPCLKELAQSVEQLVLAGKDLAGTVEDPILQKHILKAVQALTVEINNVIQASKAVASNPSDENLNKLLAEAGRQVAAALQALVSTTKTVVPKNVEKILIKGGEDIEDIAEKELINAANFITQAVAKLLQAQQEAMARRNTADIDIDEQNITEAILEACHAIGQSTAVLITSATAVQQEFNKLAKAPSTSAVYKRDPTWAQGLISAAKEVAASVQYLVNIADGAARGEASEDALVVAANGVSAATARLVAASTVKNVNSQTQQKLGDASKKVAAATRSLVEAAKAAAHFKDEQEQNKEKEKYTLSETRIAEMEQQMEILRLERELEKKRTALLEKRKEEYSDSSTKGTLRSPASSIRPQVSPQADVEPPSPDVHPPKTLSRAPLPNRNPNNNNQPPNGNMRRPLPSTQQQPPQQLSPMRSPQGVGMSPRGPSPMIQQHPQGSPPTRSPQGPQRIPPGGPSQQQPSPRRGTVGPQSPGPAPPSRIGRQPIPVPPPGIDYNNGNNSNLEREEELERSLTGQINWRKSALFGGMNPLLLQRQ